MARNRISGFFVALLLAIVSFFAIFFLLPGTAERHLGVSRRTTDMSEVTETVQQTVQQTVQNVTPVVQQVTQKTVDTVSDGIQNLIRNSNGG